MLIMEVSVVIVSMNRPDLLGPCLKGIAEYTEAEYEVFVVAYMYSDENLTALKSSWTGVHFIESRELRGFSENNNLALREVKTPYTFIVNDDTLMSEPVIDKLLEDMTRAGDKVAAVSPRIVFPDGRVQTCGRGAWGMWKYMRHYLGLVDETKPSKWTMGVGLFRTWTLNGACFLARTDVFREAGWFDETYMFTPEDIALGHKFNEMGYEVWCDADVNIVHIAGGTASGMEAAIKPARVRGALLFYSRGCCFRYVVLGAFVWFYEALRLLKYTVSGHSDGRAAVMYDTARNVMRTVFTRKSPKEVFVELYHSVVS